VSKQFLAMQCPFEKDEWEAWREHPITHWFLDEFLATAAIEAKGAFIDFAWEHGNKDPAFHASCFERAKVLNEISTLTYDDISTEAD
jgi:hypothetical protein